MTDVNALFAISLSSSGWNELGNTVVQVLAVVIGVVVGWFAGGLSAKLLARAFTGKPLPASGSTVFSIIGAALLAYLAWTYAPKILGPGGGGGGDGPGGTSPNGISGATNSRDKPKNDDKSPKNDKQPLAGLGSGDKLEIEVLATKPVSAERWYRLVGDKDRKTRTLKEIEQIILPLKKRKPNVRAFVITYEDSPDNESDQVLDLRALLRENKIPEKPDPRDGKAP